MRQLGRALCLIVGLLPTATRAEDFRVATAAFPPSLGNPFTGVNQPSSEIWLSIYDGLTLLEWGKEATPGLALSWENTAPTTWVFHLRPNVTFHNGKAFTADDVVKVFALLKTPEAASYLIASETQNVATVRAVDKLTLEIKTLQPDPILPKRLSVLMIVDPDRWAQIGADAYAREPIGTGPFRLVTWGTGNRDARLEAFDDSWRPSKSVRRLEYRVVAEHTARVQALIAGQIDMASGLQVDEMALLKNQGLQVHVQSNPQVKSIALRNMQDGPSPLKDVRVRQALNYAVDKDVIAKFIMLGTVTPVGQGVTAATTGFNPAVKPYPHDPARAKQLLKEAGYPNGLNLTVNVVTANATPDALIYQQMAQDLAAVGVNISLQAITFADYQTKYASGKWGAVDAFSQVWNNAAYQDPIRAIAYFSCLKPNPFFCDQSLVPAIQAAMTEMNGPRREAQLQDLMARYHEAAPAIWTTDAVYITAYTARTTRFEMLPTGIAFERLSLR